MPTIRRLDWAPVETVWDQVRSALSSPCPNETGAICSHMTGGNTSRGYTERMWGVLGRLTALSLLCATVSCAHEFGGRSPGVAIASVGAGALDECRADLWADLRFGDEPAFRALRDAVTQADEAAKTDWAYSEQDQRVRGLRQTLDGLADASSPDEWRSARDVAEARLAAAA